MPICLLAIAICCSLFRKNFVFFIIDNWMDGCRASVAMQALVMSLPCLLASLRTIKGNHWFRKIPHLNINMRLRMIAKFSRKLWPWDFVHLQSSMVTQNSSNLLCLIDFYFNFFWPTYFSVTAYHSIQESLVSFLHFELVPKCLRI